MKKADSDKNLKVIFLALLITVILLQKTYSQGVAALNTRARYAKNIKTIAVNGGRVDWSHKNNLIVFDRLNEDGYYDVWTMRPDGTGKTCLTCDKSQLKKRHNGNPAWHPGCEWIVFQSVDSRLVPRRLPESKVKITTNPGAGWLNNLWVMEANSKRVYQLTQVGPKVGVLHPHFSHDGRGLFWSERIGRGEGAMGEWVLRVGDFEVKEGKPYLKNIRTYQPVKKKRRFYESHGFTPDDRGIIFCANTESKQGQLGFDIYIMDLDSEKVSKLTDTPREWDEHAIMSADGEKIVWMSSEGINNPDLSNVKSDFWLMNSEGRNKRRLTYFNDPSAPEYMPVEGGVVCADSSWNKEGTKIAAYVKTDRKHRSGVILIIEIGE